MSNERNRDGSRRFLAGQYVYARLRDGGAVLCVVNEYDEDGAMVSVRENGRDIIFPVESLSHCSQWQAPEVLGGR